MQSLTLRLSKSFSLLAKNNIDGLADITNARVVSLFEYHEYNPLRLFAECCLVNWTRFDSMVTSAMTAN